MKGEAIILAAGLGTRMRPATERVPKPLLTLSGCPLIFYALAFLHHHGYKKFYINTHHHRELMQQFFDQVTSPEFEIHLVPEVDLLGTGGGLKNMLRQVTSQELVVINSDVVIDGDLDALLRFHRERHALASLAVLEKKPEQNYSTLKVDAAGRITGLLDYQAPAQPTDREYFFSGLHVVEKQTMARFKGQGSFCVFRAGYLPLLEAGEKISAYPWQGAWLDCGDWPAWHQSENRLEKNGHTLSYAASLEMFKNVFAGRMVHI